MPTTSDPSHPDSPAATEVEEAKELGETPDTPTPATEEASPAEIEETELTEKAPPTPPEDSAPGESPDFGYLDIRDYLFPGLFVLLLFVSYPLALCFGVGFLSTLVFHIKVPTFAIFTLATLPTILVFPFQSCGSRLVKPRWGRLLQLAFCIYLFFLISGIYLGQSTRIQEIIETLGMVSLPLFFALCPRTYLPRRPQIAIGILWLLQVAHGILQLFSGIEVVALAGNRNWASCLLVALTPWFWLWFTNKSQTTQRVVKILSSLVVALLAYHCASRATFLFLALYFAPYAYFQLRRAQPKIRLGVLAGGGLVVLVLAFWQTDRLVQAYENDIRPPLYQGALKMAMEKPLFGAGAGNFRREYAGRRSLAHLQRAVTASVTAHPHNEILRLAVETGIPATLFWVALMILPLFLHPRNSLFWKTIHFSAWMIIGQGMLDKTLVMPPLNLLATFFAGLLLRHLMKIRVETQQVIDWRVFRGLLELVTILAAAYLTFQTLQCTALFRKASLAENADDNESAYAAYKKAAKLCPGNVRAQSYAGICANNRLKKPKIALTHLMKVHRLEPDFAHTNREIGVALGQLGRHEEAYEYLLRETQLFPFSTRPAFLLFLNICYQDRLTTQNPSSIHQNYLQLEFRRIAIKNPIDVTTLAAKFSLAAEAGRAGEAIELAKQLTGYQSLNLLEPGIRFSHIPKEFNLNDAVFWQRQFKWRNAWLHCPKDDPKALFTAWENTDGQKIAKDFACFALSAGWHAMLQKNTVTSVQISKNGASYVVIPETGDIKKGKLDPSAGEIFIVTSSRQFLCRNQILGHLVHHSLSETTPDFHQSPNVLRHLAQRQFQDQPTEPTIKFDLYDPGN